MDKEDIKRIKDSVYELEGLLELAQFRNDKIAELLPLMRARAGAIAAELGADSPEIFEEPGQPEILENLEDLEKPEKPEKPEKLEKPEKSEKPEKPAPAASRAGREKPAFCINDRFRFRRELFGNSDAAFSDAMERVARFCSYDEAETFFLGDLKWDPERPEVADFLEIIKLYFDK